MVDEGHCKPSPGWKVKRCGFRGAGNGPSVLAPGDCARLADVKTLRLVLLLLLMLMLPLRGAMGAAMACATTGNGEMHSSHGAGHDGAERRPAAMHDHAAFAGQTHDHAAPSAHDQVHFASAAQGHDQHDKSPAHGHGGSAAVHDCNLCAGFCSFTTIPPTQYVPPPAQAGPLSYPRIVAPATSFHSDGQERPPRTI